MIWEYPGAILSVTGQAKNCCGSRFSIDLRRCSNSRWRGVRSAIFLSTQVLGSRCGERELIWLVTPTRCSPLDGGLGGNNWWLGIFLGISAKLSSASPTDSWLDSSLLLFLSLWWCLCLLSFFFFFFLSFLCPTYLSYSDSCVTGQLRPNCCW